LALLSCGVFRNRSMMGEPLFIKEQSTSFQKVQSASNGPKNATVYLSQTSVNRPRGKLPEYLRSCPFTFFAPLRAIKVLAYLPTIFHSLTAVPNPCPLRPWRVLSQIDRSPVFWLRELSAYSRQICWRRSALAWGCSTLRSSPLRHCFARPVRRSG
jgi:hypothetical protein